MSIQIINGIQLPAFDVEMLTLGKLIAVPFRQHVKEGKVFWLYPSQKLPDDLSLEQYYQPEYLSSAKNSITRCATYPFQLKVWGRCERHWHITPEQRYLLPKIAQSTVWKLAALEHIFQQYQVLKLLLVRVYCLSAPCVVNMPTQAGAFYWPQSEDMMTMGSESDTPIVSEASFNKRKDNLFLKQIYPHVNLEVLQFQVEQIYSDTPAAGQLNYEIKKFLGWASAAPTKQSNSNLAWINTIADLGNRSKEQDQGKSNYQAGTDFENIVRDSLEFLGFTIDYAHKGGAGGLDLFCSKPYPLVGECKAGKSIPNTTAVQLLNLGTLRLNSQERFSKSAKLIIGPGKPAEQLKDAARCHSMSIINPETLEKLVKLQSQYRGSVDLFKLKDYLKPGSADDEVEKYIAQVEREIRLRSHLVELVKNYLENTGLAHAGVDALHGAYFGSKPLQLLSLTEMHEILIELSSPLTGYLGRIKGSDWLSDRFYFLRDLNSCSTS